MPGEHEPFGRQPEPISMLFTGNTLDIQYWTAHLKRCMEFKGDIFQMISPTEARIYPRAVND